MMRAAAVVLLALLATSTGADTRFDLQSNFWVNLHHRLLQAAGPTRTPTFEVLTPQENDAWLRAIAVYRNRYSRRTLYLDSELISINDRLSQLAPDGSLAVLNDATLREILENAAPIYERHWWAADDRANRFWIRVARTLLDDAGEDLARDHSRAYGVPFPPVVRVDVSSWAGQFGAYTTDGPHTTISSRDGGYQGFASLEMLMHEASHQIVDPTIGPLGNALARESEKLGIEPPPDLWHALLFYTSGELTRRALLSRGVNAYTSYAYRQGLFDRSWSQYRSALETTWQEFLDGKRTRDDAIAALVAATRPKATEKN